jgi:hypothetical protein
VCFRKLVTDSVSPFYKPAYGVLIGRDDIKSAFLCFVYICVIYTYIYIYTCVCVCVCVYIRWNVNAQLPDFKASNLISQYLLVLQHAKVHIPYHNCRKTSDAHYSQCNQIMATQRNIQCIFQLMHESVD